MSYTIMIIDDEQMILDMLRDQFEMEQYQVITAKSGEEALQKLTQQPDIILLDTALSAQVGLYTSSQLSQAERFQNIIIPTGPQACYTIRFLNPGG